MNKFIPSRRTSLELLALGGFMLFSWAVLPDLPMFRKIPAFFAVSGTGLMAFVMLLSTRAFWLERILGGLDRMYLIHKNIAIFSLILVVLHAIFVPGPAGSPITPEVASIGEDLGEISMYLMIILGILSMFKRFPYHIWKWTHRLMGPLFIIGVFHIFMSDIPVEFLSMAGISAMSISAVGVVSYLYKLVMIDLKKHPTYKVTNIERFDNEAVEVTLSPLENKLNWQAGQFAFISFQQKGLREYHPFTISGAPNRQGEIRFTIRTLGNYTQKLVENIALNTTANIQGPYGRFQFTHFKKPQVWVAAGVGVTPFLARLRELKDNPKKAGNILFYYLAESRDKALHRDELEQLSHILPSVEIIYHYSDEKGYFKPIQLLGRIKNHIRKLDYCFCGPTKLVETLRDKLVDQKVLMSNIHYEYFQMR